MALRVRFEAASVTAAVMRVCSLARACGGCATLQQQAKAIVRAACRGDGMGRRGSTPPFAYVQREEPDAVTPRALDAPLQEPANASPVPAIRASAEAPL